MASTFVSMKRYGSNQSNTHILTDEEVKKTQQVLLKILNDFDALCRKHKLNYFLTGGTALGAVREQGFIPWDDDIDVIMPRIDYDQLTGIVETELKGQYYIQNLRTSKAYCSCFTKLRKNGTKYIDAFETEPERAGIFIDIYPLEDVYDNLIIRVFNGFIDEALFFIASCIRIHQRKDYLLELYNEKQIRKRIALKATVGSIFDKSKDKQKWFKICEKWQSKYKNPKSKYTTVSSGRGHYFGEMYRRDKIFPLTENKFEDNYYYMPGDSDYLLRKLYGNNYKTPPTNECREKHTVVYWNLSEEG